MQQDYSQPNNQTQKEKISIAVGVLFFEKADQTIECVQSFLPSGVPIYILNNNSSFESTQTLKDFCKDHSQVTIFDSDKNLGVSGGRNYLIRNTREKWLFFVDNDITIKEEQWLPIIQDAIIAYPDVEAFIPKLYNIYEKAYDDCLPFKIEKGFLTMDKEYSGTIINRFPGGASVVSRGLFDRLGLYEEQMFVGFEDFEFALRAMCQHQPIIAHKISTVELVHDHRILKNEKDKQSVAVRYDLGALDASHAFLKKHYDVQLEYEWRHWTKNQTRMLRGEGAPTQVPIFDRIVFKIKRIVRKTI